MSKTLSKPNYLLHRPDGYYVRVRIPADVAAAYPGKGEIVYSLRTKDYREACHRVRDEGAKIHAEFDLKRQTTAAPPDELPAELVKYIELLQVYEALADDEARRIAGLSEEELENIDDLFALFEDDYRTAVSGHPGARGGVHEVGIKAICGRLSIPVPRRNSLAFKALAMATARAHLYAMERIQDRQRGRIVETPPEPNRPAMGTATAAKAHSLDDLADYWATQGSPVYTSIVAVAGAIKELKAITKAKTAQEVTKGDIVAFKDAALEVNAPATVRKKVRLLSTVFAVAAANEKIAANPAEGVTVPKAKGQEKPRIPFAPEDVGQIFSHPVFTAGERPDELAGEAGFWMPLIALYSGARINEIGQLLTTDVSHEAGTLCFFFTTGGDKKLKTKSSIRRIPVHPALIALGFADYCKSIPQGRLFPLLAMGKNGHLTTAISKRLNKLIKSTGVVGLRKSFHSFRHGFKDAARAAGVSREVHDALTGHSDGSAGNTYGGDFYPLAPLVDAMSRITFDLPRIPKWTARG